MKRREFIALIGGAASWPLAARAQQPDRMRHVGVLIAFAADDPEAKARIAKFELELKGRRWSEARQVHIDVRFAAGNPDQYQVLAKELVALQPDVIVAHTTLVTAALQRQTGAIPIVFVNVSDPIGAGFVASLARPGGNLTGVQLYEAGVVSKWLALLKEIGPRLGRVAFIGNPRTSPFDYFRRAATAAAPALAMEIVPSRVETAADIEDAIKSFAAKPNGGLLIPPDTTMGIHRDIIIALAARYHLPAVYPFRLFIAAGGLMAYETPQVELFGQAADYVDRILRGANPADLPVQTPTKFETILNLKTAKALGLEVPSSLIVRADEVIE
jgi:putative tryptophan/tyrosine transport system substrate-binding protein